MSELQFKEVAYKDYFNKEFELTLKKSKQSRCLSIDLVDFLSTEPNSSELDNKIKELIKKHTFFREQKGSSIRHGIVVLHLWNTLAALRKSTVLKGGLEK